MTPCAPQATPQNRQPPPVPSWLQCRHRGWDAGAWPARTLELPLPTGGRAVIRRSVARRARRAGPLQHGQMVLPLLALLLPPLALPLMPLLLLLLCRLQQEHIRLCDCAPSSVGEGCFSAAAGAAGCACASLGARAGGAGMAIRSLAWRTTWLQRSPEHWQSAGLPALRGWVACWRHAAARLPPMSRIRLGADACGKQSGAQWTQWSTRST